jgi:hypothetical protein
MADHSSTDSNTSNASELAILPYGSFDLTARWMSGWDSITSVVRFLIVLDDFGSRKQIRNAVRCILMLSNRGGEAILDSIMADKGSTQYSEVLDPIETGDGQSRIPEANFRFPGLHLLAVHTCDPPPGEFMPEPVLKALKIFVTDRREARSKPLRLLLRPSPGDREVQWFKDNGVDCYLTTYRDNAWYV